MTEITLSSREPHPYGTFWAINNKTMACSISRQALYNIADELGFKLYKKRLVRITGIIICECDERTFQDVLKSYIENLIESDYMTICSAFENFMQKSCQFTISRLRIISDDQVLQDSRDCCYKMFLNCVIKITSKGAQRIDYNDLPTDKLVLAEKIQQRNYKEALSGKYLEFLGAATEWATQSDYIQRIIGYLCHEFKDETTAYIIVLTEQCADPKEGGGSGKNLFCNLLGYSTSYHSLNGSQAQYNEKFFQSWTGQRLMCISDVPKNFPFMFLKEPSSGNFTYKRLYKDEIKVDVKDGPKFIVPTNYSFEIKDGGLRRRIIPIEFTDFFTKAGGVDVVFGMHFPGGWSETDWNCFDTIIIDSILKWLQYDLKLHAKELSSTGSEKQFEFVYGKNITEFFNDNLQSWIDLQDVPIDDFKAALKNYYVSNDVPPIYRISKNKIVEALREFCHHNRVGFKSHVSVRILGAAKKAYRFERLE